MPDPKMSPMHLDALRRMSLVPPKPMSGGGVNTLMTPEPAQQGTRGKAITMFGGDK